MFKGSSRYLQGHADRNPENAPSSDGSEAVAQPDSRPSVPKSLSAAMRKGTLIDGRFSRRNRGGWVVTANGYPCFCPQQHASPNSAQRPPKLGLHILVRVIECEKRRVVVSCRDAFDQLARRGLEAMRALPASTMHTAVVLRSVDHGVIVRVGHVIGPARARYYVGDARKVEVVAGDRVVVLLMSDTAELVDFQVVRVLPRRPG